MTTKKQPAEQGGGGEKQRRRSRSRQPGSIQAYDTDAGKRWRFQIYVPKDPEYPEMGSRRLTRSGFTSTDEANDALQEALKQRKQNEKFGNKVPTVGGYADEWAAGLKLAASTITGYKKIIRNHIRPQLGAILSLAANEHSVGRGTVLLGVYAVGLGIPFLLAALFLDRATGLMNRIKPHMRRIEQAMGLLLIAVGLALLTGAFSAFSWWLLETFPALGRIG